MDEELLCELDPIKCPATCKCVLFTATCSGMMGLPWIPASNTLPYVSLILLNASLPTKFFLYDIVRLLPRLKYFIAMNCKLKTLEAKGQRMHPNLTILILDKNNISKLMPKTVGQFTNMTTFSLVHNHLKMVKCGAFNGSFAFHVLNFSDNHLTNFQGCTLKGIQSILFFDISGNFIISLEQNTFAAITIKNIYTSSHIVCCISTGCDLVAPWPFSCDALFADKSMTAMVWIIGLVGCLVNLFSFLSKVYDRIKGINPAFSVSVFSVAIADFCYCLPLLLLAIYDRHFGSSYATLNYLWRQSTACRTISFFFIFSSYLGFYAIITLAVSRYDVVRSPMSSHFKRASFCLRVQIAGIVIALLLSNITLFLYLSLEGAWQMEIGLCFLAGRSKNGFIQTLITISFIVLQIVGTCLLPLLYGLLVYKVLKHMDSITSSQQKKDKTLLRIVIVTCISNVLCWIPSACVFLVSLTVTKYSYKLLVWTVVSVLSLNALSNPFILNGSTFKTLSKGGINSRVPSQKEVVSRKSFGTAFQTAII